MNWEKEAVEDLRKYKSEKDSLENLKLRIAAIEDRMRAIKCSRSDSVPVQGGTSKSEEHLINNIVERDKLLYTYRAVRGQVQLVDKGLQGLTKEERDVLTMMYIDRTTDYMNQLCTRLHCERSSIYRIRDRAIKDFTQCMYGITNI